MVLSDRCQTHQSCAFLCALSNSVYCTKRSSGSLCLHVCPWWEHNTSDWFVSVLVENTWLAVSQSLLLNGNRLVSNAQLLRVNVTAKLNTSSAGVLQTRPVSALTTAASYHRDLQHVQLIVTFTVTLQQKRPKKDMAELTYYWLSPQVV